MSWTRGPRIVVRLLGIDGSYPSFDIRTSTHLYLPSPKLTWMAVVQPEFPDDWESGEINWLTPEEIRLMSALSLCERNPWDIGYPVIGRGAGSYLPLDEATNLSSDAAIARLQETSSQLTDEAHARSNIRRGSADAPYEVRDIGSVDDATAILNGIDSNDQLLIAGLARFLGGSRLLFALDEPEEAAVSFYVSMGAALEFIRLWLCDQREQANIGFNAVYEYLSGGQCDRRCVSRSLRRTADCHLSFEPAGGILGATTHGR